MSSDRSASSDPVQRWPEEAFWPAPQPDVDGRSIGLNLAESSFPPKEADLYLSPLGSAPQDGDPMKGADLKEEKRATEDDDASLPVSVPARHLRDAGTLFLGLSPLQVFAGLVAGVVLMVGLVVAVDRVATKMTATPTSPPPSPSPGAVPMPATPEPSPPGSATTGPSSTTQPTSAIAASRPELPWRLESEADGSSRLVVGDVGMVPVHYGARVRTSATSVPPVQGWYCVTEIGLLRQRGSTLVVGPSSTECHNQPGKVRQATWLYQRVDGGQGNRVGEARRGEWSSSGSAYVSGFNVPCTEGTSQVDYVVAAVPQFEGGPDLMVFAEGNRLRTKCVPDG